MLMSTGVPSKQQIDGVTPPESRRKQGPFVVIECFQEIPCDPCYHSCRFGAIKPLESLNDIPQVDWDRCTGCGICVAACPGLAIFVVDEAFSDTECLIAIPYEFVPLPEKGDPVYLLDREGRRVGQGVAHRVVPGRKPQGTPVVWVRAPNELSMEARHLLPAEKASKKAGQASDKAADQASDKASAGESLTGKGGMNCVSR
ncbi:MAG: 4Fe-4S binding protein [Firmicutes bacterium]|nr:4Fe-4S binding protein [Candidatus Fermentithermobacillaceae bacterium]